MLLFCYHSSCTCNIIQKAIVWWFPRTAIFILPSLSGGGAPNWFSKGTWQLWRTQTHTQTPGKIQGVFAGARWLCLTFWSSAPRWGPSRCRSESLHTPTSRHREIHAVEWQLARASPLCWHSESGGGQYNTHAEHNAGYPVRQKSFLSLYNFKCDLWMEKLFTATHITRWPEPDVSLQRQATMFLKICGPDLQRSSIKQCWILFLGQLWFKMHMQVTMQKKQH